MSVQNLVLSKGTMIVKEEIGERLRRLSEDERSLLKLKIKQLVTERSSQATIESAQRLVVYVEANGSFNADELKRSMKNKVPDYMVPAKIVKLAKFPVLPNGKIDKKALSRAKSSQTTNIRKQIEDPTNEVESKLLAIWKEVLSVSNIGTKDNFFEIGGDSILSIQVIAKARSAGMQLSANQIFEYQTVAELANFAIKKEKKSQFHDIEAEFQHLVPLRAEGSKPPLFCLHTGGTHFFFYNLLASNLDNERPVYALQASRHEGEIKLHRSINEMAADFIEEIKKVYPKGPYHFVSYCFNTAIGVEIMKQMAQANEPSNLIIADTIADYNSLFNISKTKTRAVSIIDSFKKHPFRTTKRIVTQRILDPIIKAVVAITLSNSKRKIKKLHKNHIKIYYGYKWSSFYGRIQLLLTNKKNQEFNEKVIESWKMIANKGVEVVEVKGHHNNLFHKKFVNSTAVSIEGCMQRFETQNDDFVEHSRL